MRGEVDPQAMMFSYFSPESKVPADHPLRTLKTYADQVLKKLSRQFDELYAEGGRPSIPPEQLLKGELLIALYSIRSERMFCEMLDYNLLFRWFLDMNLEEATLDQSNFSRLWTRLADTELARDFFEAVVHEARGRGLLSSEHFTVDGTLVEAWASHKSFRPKEPPRGGDSGGDFKGETRRNDTHESTTDPDAKLLRKAAGKEAKLCFGAHALMENRHGLCVGLQVDSALVPEPAAAKALLTRQARKHVHPDTLGADKGYHTRAFVAYLRKKGIRPHIACIHSRTTPGLDGRTTRQAGYAVSQRKRKRIEEIFGWMKHYGGLRKTRYRGLAKVAMHAYFVASAYNLLRLSKLAPLTG